MAALAAEEAAHLSDHAGPDEARALVYLGASTIVGDRYDFGRKTLDGVAPDRLGMKDRALRASAVAVADLIRKPPVADGSGQTDMTHPDVAADGERLLKLADQMLDRASK